MCRKDDWQKYNVQNSKKYYYKMTTKLYILTQVQTYFTFEVFDWDLDTTTIDARSEDTCLYIYWNCKSACFFHSPRKNLYLFFLSEYTN